MEHLQTPNRSAGFLPACLCMNHWTQHVSIFTCEHIAGGCRVHDLAWKLWWAKMQDAVHFNPGDFQMLAPQMAQRKDAPSHKVGKENVHMCLGLHYIPSLSTIEHPKWKRECDQWHRIDKASIFGAQHLEECWANLSLSPSLCCCPFNSILCHRKKGLGSVIMESQNLGSSFWG